ncbi:mandelate racemase/muconate lactonizing enzyme family protein [Pradoshia sp.]
MIVTNIDTFIVKVPLIKPFKTAIRTVLSADSLLVRLDCDNGISGWGEAPVTVAITGDSLPSIETAIKEYLGPFLIGRNLLSYEEVLSGLSGVMVGNTSAKAALDMAVYDCLAQYSHLPLYRYLGGASGELETNMTVSVNSPEEMGDDAERYIGKGFSVLKVKVGIGDIDQDIKRVKEIRKRAGQRILIRLDANQGWSPKEAIKAIRQMEDEGLGIELVEQPVKAQDLDGLKQVTDHVDTLIMADEAVFSPKQALQVIKMRAADLINIKLMKAGGIYQGQIINQLAETAGMECMVGSMIETHLGITAAAHFAASKKNITRFDFDAPLMLSKNILEGGLSYEASKLTLPQEKGLGIKNVQTQEGGE